MKKTQKRPVARKKTAKTPRKRSNGKTDAIRAFQLVCALIAVSICISFVIIIVYNNSQKPSNEDGLIAVEEMESFPEVRTPEPSPARIETAVPAPVVPAPAPEPVSAPITIATPTVPTPVPVLPTTTARRTTENMGSLAFVIDDAGNNLRELEPFLRIEGPLTIAVLPGLPNSAEAARRIRASGKEVILHQPMEAVGGQNPGPGAIYSNMNAEQIRSILAKNIDEVGPVVGINNHQGSKITMNREIMEIILAFCAENNIYFLDSRTTAETAAPAAARRLGMKIAERDIFLDNEQDKESMMRFLTSGLTRAQRNGNAIMIGHTWSPALAPLLAEQYPRLIIEGYTIKTVGEMLK